MADLFADLISSVEYVGCSPSTRLQSGTDHEFYRVSLRPSWTGFLVGTTSFSEQVASLQGNLQAVSGDAVALADFPDNVADLPQWDIVNGEPVTVDVLTLGAAQRLTVRDMVDAIEKAAQVTVMRVEAISEGEAHSPDRGLARDVAGTKAKSTAPLDQARSAIDKIVMVVVLLAIVAGLGFIFPRR